jgi:hypothetical protein
MNSDTRLDLLLALTKLVIDTFDLNIRNGKLDRLEYQNYLSQSLVAAGGFARGVAASILDMG